VACAQLVRRRIKIAHPEFRLEAKRGCVAHASIGGDHARAPDQCLDPLIRRQLSPSRMANVKSDFIAHSQ
jgi:hypothetical protein